MSLIPFQCVSVATNSGYTGKFTSNIAGDMLVVVFVNFGSGAGSWPETITDSAGNNYTQVYHGTADSYTQIVNYYVYVCPSCVVASNNIFTIPVEGTVYSASMGVEYTYFSPVASLDTSSPVEQNGSFVSVDDASVGDLAIACGLSVSGTWVPDPSTNARYGSTGDILWQDKVVTSSGNYRQLVTAVTGFGSTAFLMLFKNIPPLTKYFPKICVHVGTTLALGS
jgi:hypothetical protein